VHADLHVESGSSVFGRCFCRPRRRSMKCITRHMTNASSPIRSRPKYFAMRSSQLPNWAKNRCLP
jgi:hypothetical protein